VHELAHPTGVGYLQYGREQAEVLVDCVTYLACSSPGLDVGGECVPYIAPAGASTAHWTPSANTPKRSMPSPRRIENALPDTRPEISNECEWSAAADPKRVRVLTIPGGGAAGAASRTVDRYGHSRACSRSVNLGRQLF
jgi:hypothetical protein